MRARGCLPTTRALPWFLGVLLLLAVAAAACGTADEPQTGIAGSVREWGAFGGTVPLAGNRVVCLDASTFELLSSQSAPRAWKLPDSADPGDWGGTNGFSLF